MKGHDKRPAPCPRKCHPVEIVATQHSSGAPGEKGLEQVGAQLVQNPQMEISNRPLHYLPDGAFGLEGGNEWVYKYVKS
jgi:hypothetical protein